MTRTILAGLAIAIAITVLTATGCQSTGVGDPCTPEQEYDPSFLGFAESEVSVESKSFQCQTRLCLVNHFQGRVSCPYGQNTDGTPLPQTMTCATSSPCSGAPSQAWGCCAPGTNAPISGRDSSCSVVDTVNQAKVLPECSNRTADTAVYCSCRCANLNGQTNDGANYCTCPDGYSCTQLVSSIGASDQGLTGAYCVKNGTQYDPSQGTTCPLGTCDPATANCGPMQIK